MAERGGVRDDIATARELCVMMDIGERQMLDAKCSWFFDEAEEIMRPWTE